MRAEPAPLPPGHPAARFLGPWLVERRIRDLTSGALTRFSGRAEITVSGFAETGTMNVAGTSMAASRHYALDWAETGVDLARGDGSAFIRLGLQSRQRVLHACGADHYAGRFCFSAAGWVELWRVSGPRKAYLSLGRYRRPTP